MPFFFPNSNGTWFQEIIFIESSARVFGLLFFLEDTHVTQTMVDLWVTAWLHVFHTLSICHGQRWMLPAVSAAISGSLCLIYDTPGNIYRSMTICYTNLFPNCSCKIGNFYRFPYRLWLIEIYDITRERNGRCKFLLRGSNVMLGYLKIVFKNCVNAYKWGRHLYFMFFENTIK